MAGLFDFLSGQGSGGYSPPSPEQQAWLAFTQSQLGSPSPYKVPAWQIAAKGLLGGAQTYNEASARKAVSDALQSGTPQDMMAKLGQIQDPAIQNTILQSRLKTMIPQWKETKDAFGNPMVFNEYNPAQVKSLGSGSNPFGSVPGGQGASMPAAGQPQVNGDDYLKTLDPRIGTQVKAIAEGKMAVPSGFALKSPYWQQMMQAVAQYDPTFDAVNYNARSKTRNDFTSGKSAQNITALNTALGHINSLVDSADALNNTDYPIVNKALNWFDTQTGDTRVKDFNTTKDAVADELTRVFRGTGGSVSDIQSWKEKLDAANSPEQFKGVAKQMAELLGSRLDALGAQYNQGMGTTKDGVDLLTPKAQAAYKRLAGEEPPRTNASGSKTGSDQNGNKITLPPASAIAYLKANPQAAADFEKKYGISSKNFLGMQ